MRSVALLVILPALALAPLPAAAQRNLTSVAFDLGPAQGHKVNQFSWSPDGRLAFQALVAKKLQQTPQDASQNIWTVAPNGMSLQQFTHFDSIFDFAFAPSFSPAPQEGSAFLAYVHHFEIPRDLDKVAILPNQFSERVLPTADSLLIRGFALNWSTDAANLAFTALSEATHTEDAYVTTTTGTPVVQVTNGIANVKAPTFEPGPLDPNKPPGFPPKLIFEAGMPGSRAVFMVNLDGTNLFQLSPAGEDAYAPAWFPDSEFIVLSCGHDLCVINRDGAGFRRLFTGLGDEATDANVAPDDSSIVFTMRQGQNANLFIARFDPTQGTVVPVQISTGNGDSAPQWSPPLGELIAYLCAGDADNVDLCVTAGVNNAPKPCPSPDCHGCCLNGECRSGLTNELCAPEGEQCQTCDVAETCDPTARRCFPAPQCSPSNCEGCCEADGKCRLGIIPAACGISGQACAVCAASEVCDPAMRTCVLHPACDSSNCPGCCAADGTCKMGTANDACGKGAANCVPCPGGDTCSNSICVTIQTCTPANCPDCCGADGVCHGGTTSGACGSGGLACEVCSGGFLCDSSRTCVINPSCGPQNCNGCCGADGKCHLGATNDACGPTGDRCAVCTATETCDSSSHRCNIKPTCGPGNCPGCCGTDGKCHLGRTNDGCGFGGFSCAQCQANENCDPTTLTCMRASTCGPESCTGCCGPADGLCHRLSNATCGFGGFACEDCTILSGTHCDAAARFCTN